MGRSAAIVDVVVVGAGAAGLAAAKTARGEGLSVALLEAKGRIGGRAFTETHSFGVPFDHGCHWLHSASINPLTELADAYGFTYARDSLGESLRVHMGDRWATEAEAEERVAFRNRNDAAIQAAARAGRDIPIIEVTEHDARWTSVFDCWFAVLSSVDPEEGSTLDYASYRDTGEDWPVKEGYGALIARYGADVAVELDTPVERIDWRGRAIEVATPKGVITTRAVITTVSTGVLSSGQIRFDPPLPDWKRSAIEALPIGKVNKIAFQFDRDVFGSLETGSMAVFAPTSESVVFEIRPFGRALAIGHVGGRFCAALEEAGPAAMVDFALERLKTMFGAGIARHLVKTACTAWGGDPYIRGGYSAARPGHAHRRADLAAPIDDRLFFAGEAASIDSYATAHGAYLTGIAAAAAAAAARAPKGLKKQAVRGARRG